MRLPITIVFLPLFLRDMQRAAQLTQLAFRRMASNYPDFESDLDLSELLAKIDSSDPSLEGRLQERLSHPSLMPDSRTNRREVDRHRLYHAISSGNSIIRINRILSTESYNIDDISLSMSFCLDSIMSVSCPDATCPVESTCACQQELLHQVHDSHHLFFDCYHGTSMFDHRLEPVQHLARLYCELKSIDVLIQLVAAVKQIDEVKYQPIIAHLAQELNHPTGCYVIERLCGRYSNSASVHG